MPVFSEGEEAQIIFQFGELKSPTAVRRWFQKQNPHIHHSNIPHVMDFIRVRDRFRPGKAGRPGGAATKTTPEMVRGLILADQSIFISEIALRLDCSYGIK